MHSGYDKSKSQYKKKKKPKNGENKTYIQKILVK